MPIGNVNVTAEYEDLLVSSVSVNPANVSVEVGTSESFVATVEGPSNPAQTVIWSVENNTSSATTISSSGVLSVGTDETAATITVKATSTVETTQLGTATITIVQLGVPFPVSPSRTPIQYNVIKG